jgi:hypothetical protein
MCEDECWAWEVAVLVLELASFVLVSMVVIEVAAYGKASTDSTAVLRTSLRLRIPSCGATMCTGETVSWCCDVDGV